MTKKRITGTKGNPGFQKEYKDSAFLKALDETIPRPTSQIRNHVGCSHDTASKTLKRLSESGYVDAIEIDAATGTGKMNLWVITDDGKKKLEDEQEN